MSKRKHQRLLLAVQAGLLAASIGLYQPAVQAMPTGGISTTATFVDKGVVDGRTQLDVIGGEAHNVIAWDSFNLASNEAVHFTGQKDYLNYVAGTDRSFIDGRIFGDGGGTVYIINPHGIIFGDNAVIDNIGSLYASTRNLTDEDFAAFKNNGSLAATATFGGDIVNRMSTDLSQMNITLEGDTITFSHSVLNDTTATVGGGANYTVFSEAVHLGYNGAAVPASVANLATTGNIGYYKLIDSLNPDTLTNSSHYMLSKDVEAPTSTISQSTVDMIHLDGAGHQITLNGAPLFDYIYGSGIYNLSLAGSVETNNTTYTGALAKTIVQSTITSVENNANVTGPSNNTDDIYVGGIAGFIDWPVKIKNVSNHGDISANNQTSNTTYIGGIAGRLSASISTPAEKITSVYNTGKIKENNADADSYAGGIAGVIENSSVPKGADSSSGYNHFDVTIDKSYNTGAVSAKNSGGLIGLSRSNDTASGDGDYESKKQISNSYNTGTINGTTIGLASSDSLIKFTNSYDKEANQYYKEAGAAPVTADKITDGGAWRVYNSQPVLTAFLQKLDLNATYTYDGLSHSLFTIYGTTNQLKGNTTSISGTNAGTYTQGALYSDQHGYDLTSTTPVLTINPAELTLTANQATKEYDGTTEVKGEQPYYTATGLVNGEQISGLTVAYDTPDIGIGNKTVKITNTGAIKTADGNIVPITKNYKIIAINNNNTSSITKPPSDQPTNQPSGQSDNQPSDQPTNQPSGQSDNQPSDQPTDRPVDPQSGTNQAVDNYNSITGDIHVEAGSDGNDPDGDSQLKDSAGNTSIDTTHDKQAIKVDEDALARALHEDGNEGVDISSEKSGKVETETINVGDFSDGDESGKAAK